MHYDTPPKESTDHDDTNSTSEQPTLYVCTQDGCFAAYGSQESRDAHEERDHNEGDA